MAGRTERTIIRRVFEAWSIEIPVSFAETFIEEDRYWHAYGSRRSVSLSSLTVQDRRGDPVGAATIARQIPSFRGNALAELPDGLPGWAITADAPPGSRASRILSGMVATDGRILLVTVKADDLAWARATWLTIRSHRTGPRSDA